MTFQTDRKLIFIFYSTKNKFHRSGSARDTNGILIWNDVFLHTYARTGEKIAIIVLDTQGLFDNKTTTLDNSRIFALGTLISSIQVLNLSGVIQEDQLPYLKFATEFAKLASKDNKNAGRSFQNLTFLIRDWQNPNEFAFGIDGGSKYLNDFLKINADQDEDLKSVREFIYESFESLNCALIPYPGNVVAVNSSESASYDGNWGQMNENFKNHLEIIVKFLLSPDKLVLKKFNGVKVTAQQYYEHFSQYLTLFKSNVLPNPKSIYESTIEKQMALFVDDCFNDYKDTLSSTQNYLTSKAQIPIFHDMSKNKVLLRFNEENSFGTKIHFHTFYLILDHEMEKHYMEWREITTKQIEEFEEEKENQRRILEGNQRTQLEKKENDLRETQEFAKKEKTNAKNEIELKNREIAELKTQIEIADQMRIEAENFNAENEKLVNEQHAREREATEKERKNANMGKIKADQALEKERNLRAKEQAEMQSKLENEERMRIEADRQNEEKQKALVEQLEREKKTLEQRAEIDRLKAEKDIEHEKELRNKEIAKMQLKIDFEEKMRIEADKCNAENQKALIENLNQDILAAEKRADVEKIKADQALEKERNLRAKEQAEMQSKLENEERMRIEADRQNEENQKALVEQLEREKKTLEQRAEIDRLKAEKDIEHEKELRSKEIAKMQLKIDFEEKMRIEANKCNAENQKALIDNLNQEIKAAEKRADMEKIKADQALEKERNLRAKEQSEMQSKLEKEERMRIEADRQNEEKQKALVEQLEREKKALEQRAEIDRIKTEQAYKHERELRAKEVSDMKTKFELEEKRRLEANRYKEATQNYFAEQMRKEIKTLKKHVEMEKVKADQAIKHENELRDKELAVEDRERRNNPD